MNQRMRGVIAAVIGSLGLLIAAGCGTGGDGADVTAAPNVSTVTATATSTAAVEAPPPPASTVIAEPTATVSATETVVETLVRVTLVEVESGRVNFDSPTGNIHCTMGTSGSVSIACLVRDATWAIPEPVDCDDDWGATTLTLRDSVGEGVCVTDTFVVSGPPVLEYGQEVVSGDARCVSRENGVTCESVSTGAGFRLSREDYEVF